MSHVLEPFGVVLATMNLNDFFFSFNSLTLSTLNNFNNLFSDNRMHGKIQKEFYQYLSEQDIKILWTEFAEEYIDTERKPDFRNGNIPNASDEQQVKQENSEFFDKYLYSFLPFIVTAFHMFSSNKWFVKFRKDCSYL